MRPLEVLVEGAWRGHAVDVVVRPAQRLPHEEPHRQVPVVQNAVRPEGDELWLLVPLVVRHDAFELLLHDKIIQERAQESSPGNVEEL